ncbi:hypothetical protein ACFOY4_40835 [Actinomadura syzygii]|uniref:Endonuclease/exonuclease/phosphatase family protein n=1 Tax=Actinomadura syzygii TaxID=1427538 RepID=A0A5D0U7Y7_9ACTN|nr:hypothetical protein [Actinomadura syzygii]TYC14681.1 hypothetical protein FXF65_17815 [Actinomadura syzygii]
MRTLVESADTEATASADDVTIVVLTTEDGRCLDLLPEMISQAGQVDVLLLLEGKHFGLNGQRIRYRAENLLSDFGLRSFMTPSTIGELHDLVFVRWPRFRPYEHFKPDLADVFHDEVGWLRFTVEGLERPIAVRPFQWPHWDGGARLEAAQKLTKFAGPNELALLGGDANCIWPDCRRPRRWWRPWPGRVHREFEPDWGKRPPHKRQHKSLPPGARPRRWGHERLVSDRRATQLLAEAGFVNAGCVADDMTPTVNAHIDQGQGARIDFILFSPALATAIVPGSYRVWTNDIGDQFSNHRMVSVRLDLRQIGG